MSTPATFKAGDRCWHCNTHGGPSRQGDMQEERWLPAMEPCEILTVSEPNKFGNITYTIRRNDGSERMVADSWLSPEKDVCPPYFDRTEMWPVGGALPLGDSKDDPAKGFFVAFRQREGDDPYALHSNTPVVPDDVERTFHARRHTLADLTYTLAEISKMRGLHSLDADDFARLIRGAVATHQGAPAWVMDWVGVKEEDAKHFREMPTKPEACAAEKSVRKRVAKSQSKRVETEAEFIARLNADQFDSPAKVEGAEPAAATSPSPVKCVEPVSKSVELPAKCVELPAKSVELPAKCVELPAKCVELRPTHFRGVLLRDAADWEDPSAEGVFAGVSNADYHACPSLSGTGAAAYAKSAAHGIIEKVIPARSRDLGILVHGDALEGKDAAALGFQVVPGKTTTKEWCVTEDMVRLSRNCCAALRSDANTAGVLAAKGLRELSCRVRCPDTGAMLRCRFDLAPEAGAWAWDIKTTSAESPDSFESSFGEFGYAITAAHYLRVAALAGLPFRALAYACVSTEEPHEVWVVKFGPLDDCAEAFALACSAAITAARRYVHGKATGEHPKRTHAPRVARLKPWHLDALREAATTEIPY